MKTIIYLKSIAIIFVSLLIFSISACYKTDYEKPANFILIVVDTLRADYLSCYGNKFVKTPNIDKLAFDGVLFKNTTSQSSWTLPSHATLMTSKYPIQHGALSYNNPLNESEITLAETLKKNGYVTGAFISTALVSSKFGFNQGFDTFDEDLDPDFQRPVTKFHAKSLQWVEKNYRDKFFLWMHYFEPHYPYLQHEPYTSSYESFLNKGEKGNFNYTHEWIKEKFNRKEAELNIKDLNRMKALYGGEVSYIDGFIGELIDKIKKLGLYDRSLIVLTSDHGESLGEHHLIEHGESLYEPEIKVPLIIKFPFNNGGIKTGKRIKYRVQLIDVMPTILSALKIKPEGKLYGFDLLKYIKDNTVAGDSVCYSEVHSFKSIINMDWKLILPLPISREAELFNLKEDSAEEKNLFQLKRDTGEGLKKELLKWIVTMNNPIPKKVRIDNKTEEKLKSLGYLNAGIDRTIKTDGFPPADKIFEADFHGGKDAEYAKGNTKHLSQIQLEVENKGILLGDNKSIAFKAKGNINEKEGTVEFWIKPFWKWNDSGIHRIITVTGNSKENLLELMVLDRVSDSEGKTYKGPFLALRIFADRWYQSVCDVRNLSNDTPHHVVATWKADGSQVKEAMKLYVDGVKDEFSGKPANSINQEGKGKLIIIGKGDEKEKGQFMLSNLKIYSTYHDWGPLIVDVVKKTILAE